MIRHQGRWQYHYDPEIARALAGALNTPLPALWNVYDAIRCPTHVIRGGDSDLLSSDVARQMTQRGPRATLTEFPGEGMRPRSSPTRRSRTCRHCWATSTLFLEINR